ncbi:MAG: radical SAM family heme chaperone HemW, partial [Tannerella sp.]|nr:radical SAM family heme chaperone HemW [Tannerella sp.]
MAGLYIHIPFCKSRCRYCDFYSTILVGQQPAYVKALQKEMLMRSDYLGNQPISTIYFGGGTPSTLDATLYRDIFDRINRIFKLSYPLEITFEANPCDLNRHYINELKENVPEINRLSIGIQSFNDDELFLLGRRHNALNAKESILLCQEKGFNNISIDLIYGIPEQTLKSWNHSIQTAIDLNVTHISAYNLTYEEGTKLDEMRLKRKIEPVSDELCEQFYTLLRNRLRNAGFVRYEVSNFARRIEFYAVSNHNASYWNDTHYLGLGAAAHSYNGVSRSWNVASV